MQAIPPTVGSTPFEEDLRDSLESALREYPDACGRPDERLC